MMSAFQRGASRSYPHHLDQPNRVQEIEEKGDHLYLPIMHESDER
jgi:hypothetical protein